MNTTAGICSTSARYRRITGWRSGRLAGGRIGLHSAARTRRSLQEDMASSVQHAFAASATEGSRALAERTYRKVARCGHHWSKAYCSRGPRQLGSLFSEACVNLPQERESPARTS